MSWGFLSSGGETGRLIAAFDWSKTSIGPIERWPQSLRTATSILLRSPVPIVMLWGEDGVMLYNDAYSVFAGGRHPQLLGSKVREGWPEVADFNDNVMKVGLAGGTLNYRDQELTLYRHGRPEQVWMNLDYSPVLDESSKPAGVICILSETTERVAADAGLRDAEVRFRALVNASSDIVYRMSPDWTEMRQLDGRGFLADTEQPSVRWLDEYIFPEDRLYVLAAAEKAVRSKSVFELEHRVRRADGTAGWTFSRAVPVLNAAGKIVEWFGMAGDVTERRRTEEERGRLVAVIEQSPDFIGIADPAGRGVYINRGARRMSGLPDDANARDVEIMDFFLPEDHDFVRDVVLPAQMSEQGYQGELRFRRFDGGPPVPVSYDGFTIKDERGEITAFATVTRDVTERVRADALRALHSRVLELAIEDRPLGEALEKLVRAVEAESHAGVVGSILLLDTDGEHLRHGAAPGLPADYNAAIDGIEVGPGVGSCGTAAHTKTPVYVSDIAGDPLWANFRELALAHDLRACWSTPILSGQGSVLGTFAMYYRETRAPDAADLALIEFVARSAALVIERKQAEVALRESEARYRTLFESIVSGFCVFEMLFDDNGRPVDYVFVEVNPAFETQTGLVDAVGKRISELAPGHEQHWYDLYGEVALTGVPRRFEDFAQALGRWYEIYAYRVGEPEQRRVAALFNDVSARRNAEERLRELNETLEQQVAERTVEFHRFRDIVEATTSPICAFDTQFRLIAFNKAHNDEFRRVNGFDTKLGDVFPDLFIPEQQPVMRALMSRALSGESFSVTEEFGRPEFGQPLWDINYTPLYDESGAIIGAFHLATDISDRLRAEADLAATQEALRQSQKMEAMGSLTGGVAHDFNNLLTPIVGTLDMLQRRGVGGEREQRLIAGAAQSAARAAVLVQRLLAFARRQPLQPVAVDVTNLVRGMADLVSSTTGPQIKVEVDVPDDLPAATADANQLEMALLNLAVNARDAMPEGGTLRISAAPETVNAESSTGLPAGRYVRVSVADTGIGMDEATLVRAVEPFFSTKGVGKGTGLGLSMVHGLAQQLGGALEITSKPGFGTTIELLLPQSGTVPEAPAAVRGMEPTQSRGTALLVDDEEFVRMSTADMLGDLGYRVVEAASAEEAMRVIGNGVGIDLVITDHLMPGMTGTDLARAVRVRQPGLPVLVVSGYAEVDGIALDLPRLTKPFRKDELAASLASLSSAKPS